ERRRLSSSSFELINCLQSSLTPTEYPPLEPESFQTLCRESSWYRRRTARSRSRRSCPIARWECTVRLQARDRESRRVFPHAGRLARRLRRTHADPPSSIAG